MFTISTTDELLSPMMMDICNTLLKSYTAIAKSIEINGRPEWRVTDILHEVPLPIKRVMLSVSGNDLWQTYIIMLLAVIHDGIFLVDLSDLVLKSGTEYITNRAELWRRINDAAYEFKYSAYYRFLYDCAMRDQVPLSQKMQMIRLYYNHSAQVDCITTESFSSFRLSNGEVYSEFSKSNNIYTLNVDTDYVAKPTVSLHIYGVKANRFTLDSRNKFVTIVVCDDVNFDSLVLIYKANILLTDGKKRTKCINIPFTEGDVGFLLNCEFHSAFKLRDRFLVNDLEAVKVLGWSDIFHNLVLFERTCHIDYPGTLNTFKPTLVEYFNANWGRLPAEKINDEVCTLNLDGDLIDFYDTLEILKLPADSLVCVCGLRFRSNIIHVFNEFPNINFAVLHMTGDDDIVNRIRAKNVKFYDTLYNPHRMVFDLMLLPVFRGLKTGDDYEEFVAESEYMVYSYLREDKIAFNKGCLFMDMWNCLNESKWMFGSGKIHYLPGFGTQHQYVYYTFSRGKFSNYNALIDAVNYLLFISNVYFSLHGKDVLLSFYEEVMFLELSLISVNDAGRKHIVQVLSNNAWIHQRSPIKTAYFIQ
jgi:hypothetical protein